MCQKKLCDSKSNNIRFYKKDERSKELFSFYHQLFFLLNLLSLFLVFLHFFISKLKDKFHNFTS